MPDVLLRPMFAFFSLFVHSSLHHFAYRIRLAESFIARLHASHFWMYILLIGHKVRGIVERTETLIAVQWLKVVGFVVQQTSIRPLPTSFPGCCSPRDGQILCLLTYRLTHLRGRLEGTSCEVTRVLTIQHILGSEHYSQTVRIALPQSPEKADWLISYSLAASSSSACQVCT